MDTIRKILKVFGIIMVSCVKCLAKNLLFYLIVGVSFTLTIAIILGLLSIPGYYLCRVIDPSFFLSETFAEHYSLIDEYSYSQFITETGEVGGNLIMSIGLALLTCLILFMGSFGIIIYLVKRLFNIIKRTVDTVWEESIHE